MRASTSPRTARAGRPCSEIQRKSALWIYSMFFYGEDSVADNLSPYIDAAPKEEQKYFLATQQVDEARHAVFFHRFFKEVIGAGDAIASGLAYTAAAARLGLPQRLRAARPDGRRASHATARCPSSPRRSRSTTWSSRRRWPSRASTSSRTSSPRPARCPASARGWPTSPATSSATSASASRSSPSSSPSPRSARRRSPSSCGEVLPYSIGRLRAARLGPSATRAAYGFELEDIFAFGHALGRDEVAGDRLPARGHAARRLPLRPRDAARGTRASGRSSC